MLPIIGKIEQSQWYVVFSQFCSSVADLGHFHLTWSLEDNWLYHTSLLELQLTARKKLCPMYSRHNEAKTQMKYSGDKIRKTQSVHLPENHLSKFDWYDLSPIFVVMMLLHNLKLFQKPMKHHLLAIHWCNRANQILTYDCQMLVWFLVI